MLLAFGRYFDHHPEVCCMLVRENRMLSSCQSRFIQLALLAFSMFHWRVTITTSEMKQLGGAFCILRWVVTDLQVAFSLVLKCLVWSILSSTILVMPLCFKTEECRDGPCMSYIKKPAYSLVLLLQLKSQAWRGCKSGRVTVNLISS